MRLKQRLDSRTLAWMQTPDVQSVWPLVRSCVTTPWTCRELANGGFQEHVAGMPSKGIRALVSERAVHVQLLLQAHGFSVLQIIFRAFAAGQDDGYWFEWPASGRQEAVAVGRGSSQ